MSNVWQWDRYRVAQHVFLVVKCYQTTISQLLVRSNVHNATFLMIFAKDMANFIYQY